VEKNSAVFIQLSTVTDDEQTDVSTQSEWTHVHSAYSESVRGSQVIQLRADIQ